MARQWRTSETIIVFVVAAPFVFLIWSALRSSSYDADMEQRAASFQPVSCEIKSASYTELRSRSKDSKRGTTVASGYDVHAEYAYSVDGQAYASKRIKPRYKTIPALADAQAFVARYPVGAGRTCYYDPSNPSLAFLEKE